MRAWDVRGDDDSLLFAVDRGGFETSVSLDGVKSDIIAVLAKDDTGTALGRSATLYVSNGTVAQEGVIYPSSLH